MILNGCFFVACLLVPFAIPTTIRPIPGQALVLPDGSTVFVRDASINRPLLPATVPTAALAGILAAGGVIMLTATALLPRRLWGGRHEVWHIVSTGFIGSGLTHFCTEWGKHYAGFLRPIFYAACGFDDELQACTKENDSPWTGLDDRWSFPSGHASSSMAVAVIMCIYFVRARRLAAAAARSDNGHAGADDHPAGFRHSRNGADATGAAAHSRTGADESGAGGGTDMDSRSPATVSRLTDFLLALAALLPLLVAFWISLTRVHDNRHHPADVATGALLGAGFAIFATTVCLPPDPVALPPSFGGAHGGDDGGRWA